MRHLSSTCIIAVLCSFWLLLISGPRPAHASATITPAIKSAPLQSREQEFRITKESLAHLLLSNPSQNNAEAWKRTAENFGLLYQANKASELGPESLYLQARTYQLMCVRFTNCDEKEQARIKFLQLATRYPQHNRSDDALYQAALLTEKGSRQTPSAAALYQKILAQYPQSTYADKAKRQLGALLENQGTPTDARAVQEVVQKKDNSEEQGHRSSPVSNVSKTSFWSSANYLRMVVSADRPLQYRIERKSTGLALHMDSCALATSIQRQQSFTKGLLQKVQFSQNLPGNLLIDLQLLPFTEIKTFILNNPYRLVIDIYGDEQEKQQEAKVVSSPQENDKQSNEILSEEILTEQSILLLTDTRKYGPTGPNPHIKLQPESLSLTQQLGLGVKTIVIDPGHGGKDPGAMAHGLKEKDIVLEIAQQLARILKNDFQYQVILTRDKDIYIPLEKRTEIANRKKADLFISIHINAHSDQSNSGIETYFLNLATDADAMRVAALENASSTHSIGELQDILASLMNNSKIDESSRLARFVQNTLISGFSRKYRPKNLGVKQAPFYVLIGAEMPAILAELSFISNPREARLLKDEAHLKKMAQQLAKGIVAYVDHHQAAVRLY